MEDTLTWDHVDDDENLYPLPVADHLGVLNSTRAVVEQGEHVWINGEQVEFLSTQLLADERIYSEETSEAAIWDTRYHFHDGTERTVNWILLLDALNFCFWAEKNQPRWTIEYQGETLNGYWAEAAALKRAVEEGIPLWDASFLSTISDDTVAHIFRGTQTIPLFKQRVAHAREVGQVLLERYDGQFTRAIEQVQGSAVELALLLARDFSSFRDMTLYRGQEVRFFKRAQICVADVYTAFKGQQWGTFSDIAHLSAFADYKLPQVLRHYHVLEYAVPLAERVNNQRLLAPGSEEEIEIRAATVWACEILRQRLLKHDLDLTVAEIDQRLWLMGQHSDEMLPYHRTRTIYY